MSLITGDTAYLAFGSSVSIDYTGNNIIVGDRLNAVVYSWDDSDWVQKGSSFDGFDYNSLGKSVAMNFPYKHTFAFAIQFARVLKICDV